MKRILLSISFIFFISFYVSATTITSNGTGGGIWATGSTWSGGVAPVAGDNVVIAATDVVTLDANASCTNSTVNTNGTLDASTFALTVSSTFTLQSNATFKQGGTRNGPPGAIRSFNNASTFIFNGSQTSIAGYFTFGNLTWSSSGNAAPQGDLTINGNLTLLNSSSFQGSSAANARSHTVAGNVVIDGSSAILVGTNGSATGTWTITGNVTTQNGGTLRGCFASSSGDGVFNIAGHIINNGTIEKGSGSGTFTLNMNGLSSKSINGNSITSLQNLTISNTNGVTLNTSITVTGTLEFSDGKLALQNYNLIIGSSGSITGYNSLRYILTNGSGTLQQTVGTSAVIFPIGALSNYTPVIVTNGSGTITVTALVDGTNPTTGRAGTSTNPILNTWTLTGSPTNATLNFYYPNAMRQTDFTQSKAYAARWDGSSWISYRSTSNPQPEFDPTSVIVTGVNAFSSWGIFWGDDESALPVELTSFTSNVAGYKVELNWRTATEVNNYGFEVERSQTSNVKSEMWEKIGFVQGNGNSNSPKNYSFTDQPTGGKEFKYRLKQIDFNGSFEYSYEITAKLENISTYKLDQNYPNPFNPNTNISYTIPQRAYVRLRVYDMLAKEVAILVNTTQESGRYKVTFDGANLPSGAYFYKLEAGKFIEVKKLLLVK